MIQECLFDDSQESSLNIFACKNVLLIVPERIDTPPRAQCKERPASRGRPQSFAVTGPRAGRQSASSPRSRSPTHRPEECFWRRPFPEQPDWLDCVLLPKQHALSMTRRWAGSATIISSGCPQPWKTTWNMCANKWIGMRSLH